MGKVSFTFLMILILGTALYAAIAINYVGALVYDNHEVCTGSQSKLHPLSASN
jgi:hypothetical protein